MKNHTFQYPDGVVTVTVMPVGWELLGAVDVTASEVYEWVPNNQVPVLP
jgi:hypothetical protein